MAIAHESSTVARTTAAVSSLTTAFTVTSANLLVVCTSIRSATDANRVVTGITWNGTALTKVREDQNDAIDCGTGVWYLASPAAGTFNVVTTCTGSINNNLVHMIMGLTGVDVSGSPVDATGNTNTTTSATGLTVAVTTTAANSWVVSSTYAKVDAGITINGTNEVSRQNGIGGGGTDTSAMTTIPTTTTGVYTVSWTSGATDQSITSAVAFKEGAGGGGSPTVMQLAALGVG